MQKIIKNSIIKNKILYSYDVSYIQNGDYQYYN